MDFGAIAILALFLGVLVYLAWPRTQGPTFRDIGDQRTGRGKGLLQIGQAVASAYTGGAAGAIPLGGTR